MDIESRAKRHAALGDPIRLALVDDLSTSDRTPGELSQRHGVPSNLLAHHLDVLEKAALVVRLSSSGDARRRYVHLKHEALAGLGVSFPAPDGPVLFICTHNSARSQLAAAVWSESLGEPASSAGTHPAERIHPGAVEAAARAGLDISGGRPRSIDEIELQQSLVITVCDRAHEELTPEATWWHWSTPDPVDLATPEAFDGALAALRDRIETLGRTR
jgi:protein-tyrosine-phosphatase/DNA-binding transcriptional ArsR family regulator